jgi:hypothetical protein
VCKTIIKDPLVVNYEENEEDKHIRNVNPVIENYRQTTFNLIKLFGVLHWFRFWIIYESSVVCYTNNCVIDRKEAIDKSDNSDEKCIDRSKYTSILFFKQSILLSEHSIKCRRRPEEKDKKQNAEEELYNDLWGRLESVLTWLWVIIHRNLWHRAVTQI